MFFCKNYKFSNYDFVSKMSLWGGGKKTNKTLFIKEKLYILRL